MKETKKNQGNESSGKSLLKDLIPGEELAALREECKDSKEEFVTWRRDFHQHPEIAFEEKRTSRVIGEFLEGLGLKVKRLAGTGLVAEIEGMKEGKTVALRADMDALPLFEEGAKPYKSLNPGATHACGHDGHMAILMGVAKILTRRRGLFPGRVLLLFQPAEERPPGGAKAMIEAGALEEVGAIFGLHLWQPLPTGKIGLVKGAMMAAADEFTLFVRGQGGHGSMPHTTVDPILIAAQTIVNIQSIVSRNVDPLKPCVISFGMINGGTAFNIIPDEVQLRGTVRSFDPEIQALAEERLREIAAKTAEAFGGETTLEYVHGFPALVNHPEMVEFVEAVACRLWGRDCLAPVAPVMGGEDFAYYLQRVPGAFFFFGAGNHQSFPHHHPAFDIDEEALPPAVLLMSSLALAFLRGSNA